MSEGSFRHLNQWIVKCYVNLPDGRATIEERFGLDFFDIYLRILMPFEFWFGNYLSLVRRGVFRAQVTAETLCRINF